MASAGCGFDNGGMTEEDRHTRNGEIGPAEWLAMNRTGSFDWDLDTGTIDVDSSGLLVFGLSPDAFDGRPTTLVTRLAAGERDRLNEVVRQAVTGGEVSYTAHFPIPQDDGPPHWTHVQARILRSPDGWARRIVGVVRDTTAEVTRFAFVQELEKRREVQTNIVERTTNALSRAVTVDDVTAALTGPGGLARLGADGLALGLVENGSLNIIALSGESLDVLDDLRVRRLDRGLPLAEAVLSGRPRFVSSFPSLGQDFPSSRPTWRVCSSGPRATCRWWRRRAPSAAWSCSTGAVPRSTPTSATWRSVSPRSSPSRSSGRSCSTRSGSWRPDSRRRCCRVASRRSPAERSPCATTRRGADGRSAATGTT